MEIIRLQESDIERVRAIQRECSALHVVPPPIALWGAKVFDDDGIQILDVLSKSNSYTRNGLNYVAISSTYICYIADVGGNGVIGMDSFGDGKLAFKNLAGTVLNNSVNMGVDSVYASTLTGETGFSFLAGYSDASESVDSYALASVFSDGSSVNQLVRGASLRSSTWDNANNKFVTTFSRMFTNDYASSQTIKEIGLYIRGYWSYNAVSDALMLRDVLASPITLTSGQSVILYYQLEATVA